MIWRADGTDCKDDRKFVYACNALGVVGARGRPFVEDAIRILQASIAPAPTLEAHLWPDDASALPLRHERQRVRIDWLAGLSAHYAQVAKRYGTPDW